jgi:hypothetical protein
MTSVEDCDKPGVVVKQTLIPDKIINPIFFCLFPISLFPLSSLTFLEPFTHPRNQTTSAVGSFHHPQSDNPHHKDLFSPVDAMHSTIIALLASTAGFAAATPLAFAKQAECSSTTHNSAYYVCGNNGFRGYCSVDPCAKPWCPDFKLKTCDPLIFTYPNVTAPATNCSTSTTTTVQSGTTTPTVQTETTTTTFCSSTTTPAACSKTTSSTSTTSTTSTACSSTPTPATCSGTAGCPKPPVVEKNTCTGPGAFYVCANNGFRGNCSVDPCALAWCPDYESKTCDKAACECGAKETKAEAVKNDSAGAKRRQENGVCPQGTGYYQVCGNGFRGCCKADACGQASPICPPSAW